MAEIWTPEERSARMKFTFDDGSYYEQRVFEQRLDPYAQDSPTFLQYYFVKDQTFDTYDRDDEKPTILFAAGGPGQIILPDTENFADMNGYRVVYFHLRGSGFSQIPPDVSADQFLRTKYVVKDVEEIRKDLKIAQWSAIIGHSYGTVVAQWYAADHADKVQKVILSAPIMPIVPRTKEDEFEAEDETLQLEILKHIYSLKDFRFLNKINVSRSVGDIRAYLNSRVQKISQKIEDLYWNMQFVVDSYEAIKEELKDRKLDYGKEFFGALRRLRHTGWLPLDVSSAKPIKSPKIDDTQVQCGLVIASAILRKKGIDLRKELGKSSRNGILKAKLEDGEKLLGGKGTQSSARPYYVMSIYDGLNAKFFENLKTQRECAAVIQQSQKVSKNTSLAKVVPPARSPEPWDPKTKAHSVPTLVLKASADPVNEKGQAEYYYDKALRGDKVFIAFPGIGHFMALPDLLPSDRNILKIIVKENSKAGRAEKTDVAKPLASRDGLIHAFLSCKTIEDFRAAPILNAIQRAFNGRFDELIREKEIEEREPHRVIILDSSMAEPRDRRPSPQIKQHVRSDAPLGR